MGAAGEPERQVHPDDKPIFSSELVFHQIAGTSGCHAPTITNLPDGGLLAAWYAYSGPHELDGSGIYAARRSSGGNWSAPELLWP